MTISGSVVNTYEFLAFSYLPVRSLIDGCTAGWRFDFASADRVFGVTQLGHPNRSELDIGINHLVGVFLEAVFVEVVTQYWTFVI